jgi:hypothetical protein
MKKKKLPASATAVSTATAAVTTSAAATTATTATTAVLARAGFVDDQVATVVFGAVELGDRVVGGIFGRHLDEAEAARTARLAIHNDICGVHLAGRGEMLMKVLAGDAEGQITYVKFRAHFPLKSV